MSYNYSYDLGKKISRLHNICGTILRTFKRNRPKDTLLIFYIIMGVATLLYGGEMWTLTRNYCERIQAAVEMKFSEVQWLAGKRNGIRKELVSRILNK